MSGRGGTCGVAIDCPQGRMQNVNTHLRWGGTGGEGRDEPMMGWTGEGYGGRGEVAVGFQIERKVNGVRERRRGGGKGRNMVDGWMSGANVLSVSDK